MRKTHRAFLIHVLGVCAGLLSVSDSSVTARMILEAKRDAAQRIIDELRVTLDLSADINATTVALNSLLVSVEPAADRQSFVMSFQSSFLDGLTDDELRTIVAHELGHVWIFTHHPYLQTERLANTVALRVVSRDSLARVYSKVWGEGGVKGTLDRFLPAPD